MNDDNVVRIDAAVLDEDHSDFMVDAITVEDDDRAPGYVLVSFLKGEDYFLGEDDYAGLYLDPAAARTAGQALIDLANKVEY